jgi:hypothetical protein
MKWMKERKDVKKHDFEYRGLCIDNPEDPFDVFICKYCGKMVAEELDTWLRCRPLNSNDFIFFLLFYNQSLQFLNFSSDFLLPKLST